MEIISAITLFDNIISNGLWDKVPSTVLADSKVILQHLLYDENKTQWNPFIYSCWQSFVGNKEEISIDFSKLNEYIADIEFLDLIFCDGFETNECDEDNCDGKYVFYNDNTNLFRQDMFDIFENVKLIWIDYVQNDNEYWAFSLLKLLSVIDNHNNIEKIEISASCTDKGRSSWLSLLWNKSSLSLTQQYEIKHFDIKYERGHHQDDYIYIKKKTVI